jgi:microcystin-dependent protein
MSEPFIGQIMMVGFSFAPRGWANCDGQLLPIAQHQELYALLGTTYGGDGRTTFALPDLRGRVPIHVGTGPGLTQRKEGQKSGVERVTLHTTQMPAHNHAATAETTINAHKGDANQTSPDNHVLAETGEDTYSDEAPDGALNVQASATTVTVDNAGGGQAHENMQPWLCVRFVIALIGVFPPRP